MSKGVTYKGDTLYLGDKKLLELAKEKSFSFLLFYTLSGKEPSKLELSLFELMLNLSIDHGPDTPSAVEVIKAAGQGKTISEAVSLGILRINDSHGGAIEPAMELFYRIEKEGASSEKVVDEYLKQGKRLPGFGHRIYETDSRAELILQELLAHPGSKNYIKTAREIQDILGQKKGKKLPLNIDGAIAAALCSFGWDSSLGKAVFLIARTPGLSVQFLVNSG